MLLSRGKGSVTQGEFYVKEKEPLRGKKMSRGGRSEKDQEGSRSLGFGVGHIQV